MVSGQLFAGSGADTVMVGGSLGGTIDLSDGAKTWSAKDAKAASSVWWN